MILRRTFRFEAAHWLPMVAEDHKCHRMHGHSYRVEIHLKGSVRDDGMVMDFADIKRAWQPLQDALDHHCLNDLIDNPTSERLAEWIWDGLRLPLHQVVVSETADSACLYDGPPKTHKRCDDRIG
jgi:6-pyruvoyltetrahydropterin/6-carboxytetrahydropterin synthase